ncbi:TlpA family protein disulfide reductase [Yinghuangia seranimata]|uniref:TlpA family protein disulfide reductase n=1 Tax=Yinghuangia seranimata TaxID=408067 RepID=UPI00248CF0E3|nr:TlpA disulfide reductase family protein [Yinghuangia seranimata]MDI2132525.1 TlpA disulfide reductase family protein [Yinghuangia seranimata]
MFSKRPLRRAAALAAVAVIALVGCTSGNGGGKSVGGDQQGYVQGDGIKLISAGDRKSAPNVEGRTVDGQDISLEQFKGKVVVLNVWGSWCGPCRSEAPNLQKVYDTTKDAGVAFLGINTRDTSPDAARMFEQRQQITYPSVYDPEGKQILKFPGNLNPAAIPSTLVIDKDGRIAARALRGITEEELRSMVDYAMKG